MSELKTLKDLDMWHINNNKFGSMKKEHGICIEDLKTEVIKLVKHLRKEPRRLETDSQAIILVEFFNITEEELK